MIGRGNVILEQLRLRKTIPYGESVMVLPIGTMVEVISVHHTETTEWLFVSTKGGNVGYVASRFVEWARSAPTIPQSRPIPTRAPQPPDVQDPRELCCDVVDQPSFTTLSVMVLAASALLAGVALVIVLAF